MYHSARTWSEAEISKRMRPNLERMPMLTQLHADGSASFSDGRTVAKIDSVIYCTGYKYKYRLLEHLNLIRTGELPCCSLYPLLRPETSCDAWCTSSVGHKRAAVCPCFLSARPVQQRALEIN